MRKPKDKAAGLALSVLDEIAKLEANAPHDPSGPLPRVPHRPQDDHDVALDPDGKLTPILAGRPDGTIDWAETDRRESVLKALGDARHHADVGVDVAPAAAERWAARRLARVLEQVVEHQAVPTSVLEEARRACAAWLSGPTSASAWHFVLEEAFRQRLPEDDRLAVGTLIAAVLTAPDAPREFWSPGEKQLERARKVLLGLRFVAKKTPAGRVQEKKPGLRIAKKTPGRGSVSPWTAAKLFAAALGAPAMPLEKNAKRSRKTTRTRAH